MIRFISLLVVVFYTSICSANFNAKLAPDGHTGTIVYEGDPSSGFEFYHDKNESCVGCPSIGNIEFHVTYSNGVVASFRTVNKLDCRYGLLKNESTARRGVEEYARTEQPFVNMEPIPDAKAEYISLSYFKCKTVPDRKAVLYRWEERGDISGGPSEWPGTTVNTCSLNNQHLSLNYTSTTLDVDGNTQSTKLDITCTPGAARNYQLKLIASNVTNGRINFGNGVSAQVYLNGQIVRANDAGITLNNLTGDVIPISASLVGQADSAGVTTANGVLVLDAL